MAFDLWVTFVVASVLVTLLPGPSMLLVVADAMRGGTRAGLVTALGVVTADAVLLVLSLLGVGAVLAASAQLFVVLKWTGAGVLVYLGLRQWRAAGRAPDLPAAKGASAARRFATGFGVTMLNPKIIGFFVAFFPQFVDPAAPALVQLGLLGASFLCVVMAVLGLYAVAASRLAGFIRGPRAAQAMSRLSGRTLIAAGGMAALMRRAD